MRILTPQPQLGRLMRFLYANNAFSKAHSKIYKAFNRPSSYISHSRILLTYAHGRLRVRERLYPSPMVFRLPRPELVSGKFHRASAINHQQTWYPIRLLSLCLLLYTHYWISRETLIFEIPSCNNGFSRRQLWVGCVATEPLIAPTNKLFIQMNTCTIYQNLSGLKAYLLFLFTFSITKSSIPLYSHLLVESQPPHKVTALGC